MEKKVFMPKLSAKMTEGVVASWLKEEGETVSKGEILFEVEQDKVVCEIESEVDGVVKKIVVESGDQAKVDELVAVIEQEG